MVIKYNVTGADRKRLVTALSKITGVKAKYLGMPSMAYEVGDFIIDKNGTLEQGGKADSEEIESVAEHLLSEGFTPMEETNGTEAAQTTDRKKLTAQRPHKRRTAEHLVFVSPCQEIALLIQH